MRLFVKLPVGSQMRGGDPAGIVDLARRLELAGADGVVLGEHVVMGKNPEAYSWGPFPFPPEAPFPEPIVVLSAIAAVTSRIVLTTGILVAPLRPAPLLAKQLTTLDQLSSGRIEIGVGTGWQREELEAHGVVHEERGRVLTDTIGACRALWGPQPASFASQTVTFTDLWCEPGPVRAGGPPVHFSGTLNPRNVRRIVELGDGWIPIMGETDEGLAAGVSLLRERLAAADRDPSALRVRTGLPLERVGGRISLAATLAGADRLEEMGATDLTIPLTAFARDEDGLEPFFAELSRLRGA